MVQQRMHNLFISAESDTNIQWDVALVCLIAPWTHHILTTSISGLDADTFFTFKFTGTSPLDRILLALSNHLPGTSGTSVEARYIDIALEISVFRNGTNASYSIDGNHLGTTVRSPPDRGAYVYNQSLFNIEGLSNTEHTLRVDLLEPSVMLV